MKAEQCLAGIGIGLAISAAASVSGCGGASRVQSNPIVQSSAPHARETASETAGAAASTLAAEKRTPADPDRTVPFDETDIVLPLAYLSFNTQGVSRTCMATYASFGRLITAGHCFAAVSGVLDCPAELEIQWLKRTDVGVFELSGDKTGCKRIKVTRRVGAEAIDFAVLELKREGVWPKQPVQLEPAAGFMQQDIGMVGPVMTSSSETEFALQTGGVWQSDGRFLNTNAFHAPGYSGTAVFRMVDGVVPREPFVAVAGIHLGFREGMTQVLASDVIKILLQESGT